MIKLFRNLRKKLIEQSKIRNYVLYAIGEILLVVIGILIALQINNWNDRRIAKENALVVSKRLLTETRNNKKELASYILRVEKAKKCAFQLLKSFGKDYQKHDEFLIDSLLLGTYYVYNFDFNAAVFDRALSSGELSSIENDNIEVIMYQIKTLQKGYESSEKLLTQHLNENVAPFWRDKISMRQIDYRFSESGKLIGDSQVEKIDNRAILTNRVFENIIDDTYYILNVLGRRYKELDDKLTLLIKKLEQTTEN
jgi:uncharacterized membrane-anchored protein YhcB (DUF1043 family)